MSRDAIAAYMNSMIDQDPRHINNHYVNKVRHASCLRTSPMIIASRSGFVFPKKSETRIMSQTIERHDLNGIAGIRRDR